jgi:hypothetical protein
MGKRRFAAAFLAALLAAVATATATADHQKRGFKTREPAQLVAVEPGVRIDPILSTGDIIGDPATGYQMSGIPDGLGAYVDDDDDDRRRGRWADRDDDELVHVLMNHELDGPNVPPNVGARISKVTIDPDTRRVRDAEYLFTGLEGFTRFCSSTLEWILGKPLYFTGEEDPPQPYNRGGSSIVMNARTGEWEETEHFGKLLHENNVPMKGLRLASLFTTDDDFRTGTTVPGDPSGINEPNDSFLYAYFAPTWRGLVRGTQGQLHVFRSDEGDSTNDIQKGETIRGTFQPIPPGVELNDSTLEAYSAANGFRFVRLEDFAVAKDRRGRAYFVDTGELHATSESVRGRLYQLDVNRWNPRRVKLTLLMDGDQGDNLVNPDNIDTSQRSVVIQEDRNSEHRDAAPPWDGYSRVLVYNIRTGGIRYVARVNTPPALRPGTWESSGVLNAFDVLGRGWWWMDVQAHSTPRQQPGPDLRPRATPNGEHGQLMAVYIPRS